MEGHSFAPVILTYHNVYLVYSAYLFQLITNELFERNPFQNQTQQHIVMQLWFV